MRKWEKLPEYIRCEAVKPYYDLLKRKWFYRFVKRLFDFFAALFLLVILFVPSLIIGILICCTSKGGAFFIQQRVGRYGKPFGILKFRTMMVNSEGDQHVTCKDDIRITKVGKVLRKTHLDEFPQLLNVICGQMSFVGTRPEVRQFVDLYKDVWYSTLLMRPGVTSTASYSYDDEAKELDIENINDAYLNKVLPYKMDLNLEDIKKANLFREIGILWKTMF